MLQEEIIKSKKKHKGRCKCRNVEHLSCQMGKTDVLPRIKFRERHLSKIDTEFDYCISILIWTIKTQWREGIIVRVWAVAQSGSLQHYCASVRVCVCLSVCSLHKCMRFKQQLESTLHGTSEVGRLYFCPVRGRPPAGSFWKFDCSCMSLHDCIVSMLGLAFGRLFHFALYNVRPTTEPIAMLDHGIANAGSASWVV